MSAFTGNPLYFANTLVRDKRHGYVGLIVELCPERPSEAWMDGQDIPLTQEEREGEWRGVCPLDGGAVLLPLSSLEVVANPNEVAGALKAAFPG